MAEPTEPTTLEAPRVYLVHMMVFTLVVAILVAVLWPSIQRAFMANPGLNGVIIGTLFLGMFHSYRMVWRLFPEIGWVNTYRVSEAGGDPGRQPRLLAEEQDGKQDGEKHLQLHDQRTQACRHPKLYGDKVQAELADADGKAIKGEQPPGDLGTFDEKDRRNCGDEIAQGRQQQRRHFVHTPADGDEADAPDRCDGQGQQDVAR